MQVSKNFSVRVNETSVSFNGFLGRYFKYIDIDIRFRLIQKKTKPFLSFKATCWKGGKHGRFKNY